MVIISWTLPPEGLAWTHVAISNKSSVKGHNEHHSLFSGVICELRGSWVQVCLFSFKYPGEMQSKIHIQILEKLKKNQNGQEAYFNSTKWKQNAFLKEEKGGDFKAESGISLLLMILSLDFFPCDHICEQTSIVPYNLWQSSLLSQAINVRITRLCPMYCIYVCISPYNTGGRETIQELEHPWYFASKSLHISFLGKW